MIPRRVRLLLSLVLLAGCASPPSRPDVVLISLDTTRADALSAWGLTPAERTDLRGASITPHLDALAASGVRYAWAFAHAPSTLASHATLFTGSDPHAVGIPRNGFPLLPGPETLAERAHTLGYTTTAVIGSSALARPMGIDRGFDRWDERFSITRTRRHEATATEVTDRALAELRAADPHAPQLLFAHYYDAHGPYQAPAPYGGRYHDGGAVTPADIERVAAACRAGGCAAPELQADLTRIRGAYLEEVAYVDAEVGRLLAEPARANGRIVVVFGDHGEMLGEDDARPFGHGADVDPPATHVPLLIVAPGLAPAVVDTPVGLRDVAGLLLKQMGDTAPFAGGAGPERAIPMEATQPGNPPPGWNNRDNERGLVDRGALVIEGPDVPAQYWTLDGTPLPDDDAARGPLLDALHAWHADAPRYRAVTMDAETHDALKALGYEQ